MFGFGAGIFFLGYVLFEVPSNLLLERFGARLWIARIMVTWGLVSASGWRSSPGPTSFYVLRFLLGVAEAGFFPGIILYLTYWFPAEERARWIGMFMIAIPLSSVIGGPLSGWILDQMNGVAGVKGWQWLFVLEGLPSVFVGLACFVYLDDGPAAARWLDPAERDALTRRLEAERHHREAARTFTLREALLNPRVFALAWSISASSAATTGSAIGCRRSSRVSPRRRASTRPRASASTRSPASSSRCRIHWPWSA